MQNNDEEIIKEFVVKFLIIFIFTILLFGIPYCVKILGYGERPIISFSNKNIDIPIIFDYENIRDVDLMFDYYQCDGSGLFGHKPKICLKILKWKNDLSLRKKMAGNLLLDNKINSLMQNISASNVVCIDNSSVYIEDYKLKNDASCLAIDERILQLEKAGKYKPTFSLIKTTELQWLWDINKEKLKINNSINLKESAVNKLLNSKS